MDFELTKQEEAVSQWFEIEDSKFHIKILDGKEIDEVAEMFFEKKHDFIRNDAGRLERVEWTEMKKDMTRAEYGLALMVKAIIGWENVSINGKKASCTEANKIRLIRGSTAFVTRYNQWVKELHEKVENEFGSTQPSKN